MQMLMMIVESAHRDLVEAALTEHQVVGYTEIPTVYGSGATGPRLGSRAFPETSSIVFTVVEEPKVQELLDTLESTCKGMRVIVWKVDRMI